MAELYNSKRSTERATYTPIKPDRGTVSSLKRPLDKWSYIAALSASKKELDEVAAVLIRTKKVAPKLVALIVALTPADDRSRQSAVTPDQIAAASEIPAEACIEYGEALHLLRAREFELLCSANATIEAAYTAAVRKEQASGTAASLHIPPTYRRDASVLVPSHPGAVVYRFTSDVKPLSKTAARALAAKAGVRPSDAGAASVETAVILSPSASQTAPLKTSRELPPAIDIMLRWAVDGNVQKDAALQALALLSSLAPGRSMTRAQFESIVSCSVSATADLNKFFKQRMATEPVGLLHLERLNFFPAGIERGELVYSVPLSPAEEVNISHKEWSNTSQEFEQIVTDYLESYSEEGVAEKSELAQSTNSQSQHNTNFSFGVSASASGFVSIATNLGYNVANSASNSEQLSRNHSSQLTRQASARVKKEHKTSFKVASASGTQDQAVRLIKNPFVDKAVRVDYYQLVRKWLVNLYRYGVRLTYDLTIPEPGSDILDKIIEIARIKTALDQGFASPDATLWWAAFDLAPGQVNRQNYQYLAAQYGCTLECPPEDSKETITSMIKTYPDEDSASNPDYNQLQVDVPDGFEVCGVWGQLSCSYWNDQAAYLKWITDFGTWLGCGGTLLATIKSRYVSAYEAELKVSMSLKQEAYEAWQMRAWGVLYEAARARYDQNITMLKDRLTKLQEALGAQDAFSLRIVERDEVMKGVLRWLFGPSFSFVPPGLPADPYGANQSVLNASVWGKALAQGEVIKFLHQAIEWENMLYFLYPYFWSHTSRWDLKKYLDHPDLTHRTFLKAGSARVVLTIRPGFEKDFVTFLETGKLDGVLSGSHPYMTIAEEMQAFAQTNYPGISSANPVEDARPLLTPLQRKAWDQMQGIIALLEKYKKDHNQYPTTAEGLAALASYGSVPAADPWGNAYRYVSPGAFTDFELSCLGADAAAGGEGDAADITSWAEASLIGQWYEYTPTAALDIAFNEILPTA